MQKALEKAVGLNKAVMTYGSHGNGSVFLKVLVPESILHIFNEGNTEDLVILTDSCVITVMKLEVDEAVANWLIPFTVVYCERKC